MPKYKVPPENFGLVDSPTKPGKTKHYPTIYFPVNKAIMDKLEIDQDVTVNIKGVIKSLESRQGENMTKMEVRMELREIEMYAKGEFEKLAEDEDDE